MKKYLLGTALVLIFLAARGGTGDKKYTTTIPSNVNTLKNLSGQEFNVLLNALPSASKNVVLKKGDSGVEVAYLQRALSSYDAARNIIIDGFFGDGTEQALLLLYNKKQASLHDVTNLL